MYWKLRTEAITILLILGLTRATLAGLAEDQYAVASHHYTSARWDLAVDEFTVFLQQYPEHEPGGHGRFLSGRIAGSVESPSGGPRSIRGVLARSPAGKYVRQSQFRVGETLYMVGQYEEARSALEEFRRGHPDDALCAYVLPYLGEIALVTHRPEDARDAFSDALQQYSHRSALKRIPLRLARSCELLQDPAGAIRFYQFLADSDPPTAMSDDALLQMAILLYQQNKFDEAITALRKHRERFPGSELAARAAYWLGMSLISAGKNAEAAETLSAAADRFESHELIPAMAFAAGDALRRNQELPAAQRYFERVVAQHPESTWADDALQTLVQLAWQRGDCQQVHVLAGQFAQQYGDSPLLSLVRQTVARAHLKQGEYEQASSVLEPLVTDPLTAPQSTEPSAIPPNEAPAPTIVNGLSATTDSTTATRYYLALAYLGGKRHEEALDLLDQLSAVQEPRELVDGVKVARASALIGTGAI